MKKLWVSLILLLHLSCDSRSTLEESRGFFPIKEHGKWGFINSTGQIVIKCQFGYAGQFSEGFAPVRMDTLCGFIDTAGQMIVEPAFSSVGGFSDGLCYVEIQRDTGVQKAFIRKTGDLAFSVPYDYVGPFHDGRAEVTIGSEVCYIDKQGKVVFNTHYPNGAGQFKEGVTNVWGGDVGRKYFDTSGNFLPALEGKADGDFSEGLITARVDDYPCYLNKAGEVVFRLQPHDLVCTEFSEGLAQVTIPGAGHKTGYINKSGKIVIPITYAGTHAFKEGLAAVWKDGAWGFINKKGEVAIAPRFDEVSNSGFQNGLCSVSYNNQWAYINRKGEIVWKEKVGLEYGKLDLAAWDLDTLRIDKPFIANRYGLAKQAPRIRAFSSVAGLTLRVDTADLTVFADHYLAHKLYLLNASKDTLWLSAQDAAIKIIQQAKNVKGEWQDIEEYYNSFCGNSYYRVKLLPNEYRVFPTPIFKGDFRTVLRFRMELQDTTVYSNSYRGSINKAQFVKPKSSRQPGVAVWAF